MNREIKFRAWNGDEMVTLTNAGLQYFDFEGSYALSFVVDGYSGFWSHEQYDTMSEKASKFPIMQYTGLKDKNGKEIYEGDIIGRTTIADRIVYFDNCGFRTKKINNNRVLDFFVDAFDQVVGNIYENPNLIK